MSGPEALAVVVGGSFTLWGLMVLGWKLVGEWRAANERASAIDRRLRAIREHAVSPLVEGYGARGGSAGHVPPPVEMSGDPDPIAVGAPVRARR